MVVKAEINYERLPEGLQGGVQRYIEDGIRPGSFLQSVISNYLMGAVCKADDINRGRMVDIVKFFYNEAPMSCWGSKEKMEQWIKEGGMSE